jgi:hypothetical protein
VRASSSYLQTAMLDVCFVRSFVLKISFLLCLNVLLIRSITTPLVVLRNPDPMIYDEVTSDRLQSQCIVNPSRSLSVRSKLQCGVKCKDDVRCTAWNYWNDTYQCDLYYSVAGDAPASYNVTVGCRSYRSFKSNRGFYLHFLSLRRVLSSASSFSSLLSAYVIMPIFVHEIDKARSTLYETEIFRTTAAQPRLVVIIVFLRSF